MNGGTHYLRRMFWGACGKPRSPHLREGRRVRSRRGWTRPCGAWESRRRVFRLDPRCGW